MRCSVLIVNWRTCDLLRSLLESLRRYPPEGGCQTIVVDNASEDFDLTAFQRGFPEVLFLPQTENTGFARGNNIALQHAVGDIIVTLNPDTEVTEGALETLVQFLDAHPRAAIAAPQLILPDGRVQDSCREFPWPMGILWVALRLHKFFPRSHVFGAYRMTWFDHRSTRQVDQPMATCWAIPRKVLDGIGFMDEDFPILFNDVDWAWRAKQAGYEIWFVAEARVKHVGAQGTRKAGARIIRESHEGMVRFYRKDMRGHSPAAAIWMACAISKGNCYFRTLFAKRYLRG